ncbi:MAG: AAA family ATPase [Pseudomonadota bacterium]
MTRFSPDFQETLSELMRLAIGMPNREAREEILAVHTRRMPLADDVELGDLARAAHGFTGADLRAVVQEAAMHVARRFWVESAGEARPDVSSLQVDRTAFLEALGAVTPSSMREVAVEAPEVRFDQIGGYDAVKQRLRSAVLLPLREAERLRELGLKPPSGVVLHGPPGTGKTLFARALACEAEVNLVAVSGPELLSRFVGDSERAIREIFDKARQAAPCVLFFDEIDSVAMPRGGAGNEALDRVVAQLLTELAGVRPLSGVTVVAATNRLDRIDRALLRPGRLDDHIELGLPTLADRRSILGVLGGAWDVDAELLEALAGQTEGMAGADLEALVMRATLLALEDSSDRPVPSRDHFASALALLRERMGSDH